MSLIEPIHRAYVHKRRVELLSQTLEALIPQNTQILDIGCGDGGIAWLLQQMRPDIAVRGIDILVRSDTRIPVNWYDGQTIPYKDKSFDVTMLIDVLHHTSDPALVLREAVRVTREAVLIKDHTLTGFMAASTLRFMDWIGNAPHGVTLPYNYWSQEKWFQTFTNLGLSVTVWKNHLKLYPGAVNWIFGRSLHFVARIELAK